MEKNPYLVTVTEAVAAVRADVVPWNVEAALRDYSELRDAVAREVRGKIALPATDPRRHGHRQRPNTPRSEAPAGPTPACATMYHPAQSSAGHEEMIMPTGNYRFECDPSTSHDGSPYYRRDSVAFRAEGCCSGVGVGHATVAEAIEHARQKGSTTVRLLSAIGTGRAVGGGGGYAGKQYRVRVEDAGGEVGMGGIPLPARSVDEPGSAFHACALAYRACVEKGLVDDAAIFARAAERGLDMPLSIDDIFVAMPKPSAVRAALDEYCTYSSEYRDSRRADESPPPTGANVIEWERADTLTIYRVYAVGDAARWEAVKSLL